MPTGAHYAATGHSMPIKIAAVPSHLAMARQHPQQPQLSSQGPWIASCSGAALGRSSLQQAQARALRSGPWRARAPWRRRQPPPHRQPAAPPKAPAPSLPWRAPQPQGRARSPSAQRLGPARWPRARLPWRFWPARARAQARRMARRRCRSARPDQAAPGSPAPAGVGSPLYR